MRPITGGLVRFSKTASGNLDEMIGTHVDDFRGISNEQIIGETKLTAQRYESKVRTFDKITFAGISIDKQGTGCFIHQRLYTSRLKEAIFN